MLPDAALQPAGASVRLPIGLERAASSPPAASQSATAPPAEALPGTDCRRSVPESPRTCLHACRRSVHCPPCTARTPSPYPAGRLLRRAFACAGTPAPPPAALGSRVRHRIRKHKARAAPRGQSVQNPERTQPKSKPRAAASPEPNGAPRQRQCRRAAVTQSPTSLPLRLFYGASSYGAPRL
jgi:hypothetical protein